MQIILGLVFWLFLKFFIKNFFVFLFEGERHCFLFSFSFFFSLFNDLQAQIPSAATARTWYCNSCSLRLTAGLILNKNESFKGFNYKMKFFFKSHVCSLAWSRLTLNLGEHHICEVPGIADLLWPTHFCDYLRYSQS